MNGQWRYTLVAIIISHKLYCMAFFPGSLRLLINSSSNPHHPLLVHGNMSHSLYMTSSDRKNLNSSTESFSLDMSPSEAASSQFLKDLADEIDEGDAWELAYSLSSRPYISTLVREMDEDMRRKFLSDALNINNESESANNIDPLWEQVKVEAKYCLEPEPQAGPQLYQHILSQNSLMDAIIHVVSNEIATDLILATEVSNLFHSMLTVEDSRSIHLDVMAAAMRSPSVGDALTAILFNRGLHALVCHRVSHRLWNVGRTGLAKYLQSTVSRTYQADIHPAAKFGAGIFMNCGSGIVIGETAVIGDDVSIMQGVTLGGTGKERGDRHPKVGNGVLLQDSATVLGNIEVGDGAVITAKSIVTKPVPPLARVSGIPAKVRSYREPLQNDLFWDDGDNTDTNCDSGDDECLELHLRYKYMQLWEEDGRS